jgi:hypothetical protein
LEDSTAPWFELLRYRYGSLVANFLYNEGEENLKHSSIWWRDIWRLGSELDDGWFCGNIRSILGDGNDIAFWKDKWLGSTSLRDMFPNLYTKTMQPESFVTDMGSWESDAWAWNFDWNATLTEIEVEQAHDLLLLLEQTRPCGGEEDRRRWLAHEAGFFTVKTAYNSLLHRLDVPELDTAMVHALKLLWINNVPSKVSIFGWRLLLEKLPTKDALYNKGIITNNQERRCVLCLREYEDINHIFFNCSVSIEVWSNIFRWLRLNLIHFVNICNHFNLFGTTLKGATNKRSRHLIWLATTWCLWRHRNNIVFRGDSVNASSLVEQIKYIAWFWLIGREKLNVNVAFSDWCTDPLPCFR